jgi:hypothetical protein
VAQHRPADVTTNERAFRVLVRNAMFRRVSLAAQRRYAELGELDADSGWDADAWATALDEYFESYVDIGIGPEARGPDLLHLTAGPDTWSVRQVFDDPDGDHDWGISAEVDLAASNEQGVAAVRVTSVGPT